MTKRQTAQKRPTDVASNAVRVMQIATGQITPDVKVSPAKNEAAAALGKLGGQARATALSAAKRKKIAKLAASKRWGRVNE